MSYKQPNYLMVKKERLAFISPVLPSLTGGGLAMRAGAFLETLARAYEITFIGLDVYGGWKPSAQTDWLWSLCAKVKCLDKEIAGAWLNSRKAWALAGIEELDRIHVFRLILAPVIKAIVEHTVNMRAACTLDLDEVESRTCMRMAALYGSAGDSNGAKLMRLRAQLYSRLERQYLHRFDRVYLCQAEDATWLSDQYQCVNTSVCPNVVRLPRTNVASRTRSRVILFVGSLSYYPNEEGMVWFCARILPRIIERMGHPVHVFIVGAAPGARIRALACSNVSVVGEVSEVASFYAQADLAIVPIRAGGGTRIKILEAFSYKCPVVATTIGAEGLDVSCGNQLLIADTELEFAEACTKVMADSTAAQTMVSRAFQWVSQHHSILQLEKSLLDDAPLPPHGKSTLNSLDFPWESIAIGATFRSRAAFHSLTQQSLSRSAASGIQ